MMKAILVWLMCLALVTIGVPASAATLVLVPVSANVEHQIVGNEIIIPTGSVWITLELYVSDWDENGDGVPLLDSIQATIDESGLISGDSGSLDLVLTDIPCTSPAECPAGSGLCRRLAQCVADGSFEIDTSRPDYVFAEVDSIAVVDSREPMRWGLVDISGSGVPDPGVSRYAGTMILASTSDARGTFTVGFLGGIESFMADGLGNLVEPLILGSARITFRDDCNENGVPDDEDILNGTSTDCDGNGRLDECEMIDCNGNGIFDGCDISAGGSDDCDGDGVPDECSWQDCNGNGVFDGCDIASGISDDCDGNRIPDECEEEDCNANGVPDACDIIVGDSDDCDGDGVPDECDQEDCNGNGIGDRCDIAEGHSFDRNGSGVPDECEPPTLALVPVGASVEYEIAGNEIIVPTGSSWITLELRVSDWDVDQDGVPRLETIQATIDESGLVSGDTGSLDLVLTEIPCSSPGECPAGSGLCRRLTYCVADGSFEVDASRPDYVFADVDSIEVVDTREPMRWGLLSSTGFGVPDPGVSRYAGTMVLASTVDAQGTFTVGLLGGIESFLVDEPGAMIEPLALVPARITFRDDCNENGIADDEDLLNGTSTDCDGNGRLDECEMVDCNENGVFDGCDIQSGTTTDCNGDGVPDECSSEDCNLNGVADVCDIANGTSSDCDGDEVPDECTPNDCNLNDVPDACDVTAGTSTDCNENLVPDECEVADCNNNGVFDACEILAGDSEDCDGNEVPDECDQDDCNGNGIGDRCDIAAGGSFDRNGSGVPDECEPPTIALVPVSANRPYWLRDDEIVIPLGITRVTLEIRVAHWDVDGDGNPLLRAIQGAIDNAGLSSGSSGSLELPLTDTPCAVPEDCTEAGSVCRDGTFCSVAGSALIDESRSDFVFAGEESLAVVDGRNPIRYGLVLLTASAGVSSPATSQYAGRLVLETSADATGTFALHFVEDENQTFLTDTLGAAITPLHRQSARITVTGDCNENGVPDTDDLAGGTGTDCNENELLDECDIRWGISSDCDGSGVPDECKPPDDCNGNDVVDACDIAANPTLDANDSGVLDECEFPPAAVAALGSRYIEIIPPASEVPIALRVSSPDLPCLDRFVFPHELGGILADVRDARTSADWGSVALGDLAIIPGTTYVVTVDYGGGIHSRGMIVTTSRWGDTVGAFVDGAWMPPDGSVDIADTIAILDRFAGRQVAPRVERVDLSPVVPDRWIDITDAVWCLEAFAGKGYPFALPCP